jgi:hypothetical protein
MQTIIDNLKTVLQGLTWTVTGASATASFSNVYTARIYSSVVNTPYACIDESENGLQTEKIATRGANGNTIYQRNQTISIYIIAFPTDVVTIEESTKRIRFATEIVENKIKDGTILTTLGVGWNYTGWSSIENEQNQIIGRKLDLTIINTL